jgi:hypothetical protein
MDKKYRLAQLEAIIAGANLDIFEALKEIKDNGLYEGDYETFKDYLREKHDRSYSWYKQLQANYNAWCKIDGTMELARNGTMRVLRQYPAQLRQLIYDRAAKEAKIDGYETVQTRHIKAAGDTIVSMIATGGYVDNLDGSMIAFDAAIRKELIEIELRQRTHAIESARRKWKSFTVVYGEMFILPDFDLSPGEQLEIRVAIVSNEESEK